MADNNQTPIEVKIVVEDRKSENPCKLCLEEIGAGKKFTLEKCGCFFCVDCMTTYVEVLVQDGIALHIACPDSECVIQGSLETHEVGALVQAETYERYLKLKDEQEVAVNPLRSFCPNPSCSYVCKVSTPEMSKKAKKKKRKKDETQDPMKVTCPSCGLEFCHICKYEWAKGHTCPELGVSTFQDEINKLKVKAGLMPSNEHDATIKRCPVCCIYIERDRGCAQMMCKNCSHVFCWYCLKLLDNDFLLRHYDKGPCKDFLGHSRTQVVWHRLAVVGMFAALCILLIVALPVLIMMTPFFLCFKSKECCERAWRRAQQENNNALFHDVEMEESDRRTGTVVVVSEMPDPGANRSSPTLPSGQPSTSLESTPDSFSASKERTNATETKAVQTTHITKL